jgi:hypothetical protein
MAKHLPVGTMANVREPLVLFLIGMRINTFWRVWEWLPAVLAMGPMIVELYRNPELGFLRARTEMAARSVPCEPSTPRRQQMTAPPGRLTPRW